MFEHHLHVSPDLEHHPPIFLLASKPPNAKSGSIDSALRCLFSTRLISQLRLAEDQPAEGYILHITNKLISLGLPSSCSPFPANLQLHLENSSTGVSQPETLHVCPSWGLALKSFRQLQTLWFAVLAREGFKSRTPPDEQLPVLSAPLLSPALLLADGRRSCLLLNLLWWMATSLSATPGVLQPLSLFPSQNILNRSLSHLFALALPAFGAGSHVYNIDVH